MIYRLKVIYKKFTGRDKKISGKIVEESKRSYSISVDSTDGYFEQVDSLFHEIAHFIIWTAFPTMDKTIAENICYDVGKAALTAFRRRLDA